VLSALGAISDLRNISVSPRSQSCTQRFITQREREAQVAAHIRINLLKIFCSKEQAEWITKSACWKKSQIFQRANSPLFDERERIKLVPNSERCAFVSIDSCLFLRVQIQTFCLLTLRTFPCDSISARTQHTNRAHSGYLIHSAKADFSATYTPRSKW